MKTTPIPDLCKYDADECPPKPRGHKDKRNWCKGKVGRRHQVEWQEYTWGCNNQHKRKQLVCINCNKKFYHTLGWLWRDKDETDEAFEARRAAEATRRKLEIEEKTSYYLDFI